MTRGKPSGERESSGALIADSGAIVEFKIPDHSERDEGNPYFTVTASKIT